MKKQLLVGLATGLFLYGMTSTAMALNFDGKTIGTFENPTGPVGMVFSGVASGSGLNPFTWGVGAPWAPDPSSLLFTGTDFSVDFENQSFQLGTLEYYNGIIAEGTEAYSVDLNIGLLFNDPVGLDQHFTFTLDLLNTPNIGNNNVVDADYVYLPTAYSGTIFSQGGVNYNLTLGFANFSGEFASSSANEFHVFEGGTATADLMGTITSDVAPVPEPATMLLFGTGMAGLAAYRRRQQAKKK